MAGYRDINGASQIVRRNVQAVDLQQENRTALESVMVAMAAGGRVQEMALIAQTLEKVNTNADLSQAIADLTTVVAGIKHMNEPTTHDHDELARLRDENAQLKAQTKAAGLI